MANVQRQYSNVVEALRPCCRGNTAMLQRHLGLVAEVIQQCYRHVAEVLHTAIWFRSYSHFTEAIHPCFGGMTAMFGR